MDINELVRQHADILDQVGTVRALLELPNSGTLAGEVGHRLDVLAATVALHVATEDREFYPALLSSSNPNCRETAERFFVEMGHLRRAFLNFREKWRLDRDIKSRFRSFLGETNEVFALLETRIRRENAELIPRWAEKGVMQSRASSESEIVEPQSNSVGAVAKSINPFAQEDLSVLRRRGAKKLTPG